MLPVELERRLINKREAGRSSDVVSCRQIARSLVPSTYGELQQAADYPYWDGTLVRAFPEADEPRELLLRKETAMSKHNDLLSPSA
jgi:hypothetical protein